MLTIRKATDRGQADFGWLQARYSFSFASYYNPQHMGFGALRVLNQDRIDAGRGFPRHGHENMEIVTLVLEGALEHKDSMGFGSVLLPGEVQLMSAGTGVQHSEFNASQTEPLHLMQMWVLPAVNGTEPRYEQRLFERSERAGRLRLVVSPDGADGSLMIGQAARMYIGNLSEGDRVEHIVPGDTAAWLHVARGSVKVDGHTLEAGDGGALYAEVEFEDAHDAEVVLWETPFVDQ